MIAFYYVLLLVAVSVLASSPSGTYAPGKSQCPASSGLREGNDISKSEKEWIQERHEKTDAALRDYLDNANLTDFDVDDFFDNQNRSVNIAISVSGGGYRAMLSGAGMLSAFDNRSEVDNSPLAGLLQSLTYIAGLSGGAWLLGLLFFQNFPSITEVVLENPNDVWNLTESRQLVNMTSYWQLAKLGWNVAWGDYEGALTHLNNYYPHQNLLGIGNDISAKKKAGFVTTITDYWSRGLAYQLFPKGKNNHEVASTWTDIRNLSSFKNHNTPFPLVTALGRRPDTITYNLNSTIVEFNPFELGSFDKSLNSFTDIKYIGSSVNNGKLNGLCYQGFDNAAYVVGTSSSLFNQFLNTLVCDDCNTLSWVFKPILRRLLNKLSKLYFDVAPYKPNPFYKSEYADSKNIANNETLFLFDGGLGGEVIPLLSLATTHRALDVVFALDNSEKYPNGSSLVAAYERQFSDQGRHSLMPYVPGEETFLKQNLTAKPVFFGCDASNLTDLVKDDVVPPLVVYFANRPFQYWSNTSTFKLSYNDTEKKGMITNGYEITTRFNSSLDLEWQTCVACAVIRREEERQDIEQSEQCQKCFERYCWDGSVSTSSKPYYRPVNFTLDGLTNASMTLWDNANLYIEVSNDTTVSTVALDVDNGDSSLWSSILLNFKRSTSGAGTVSVPSAYIFAALLAAVLV